jgi:hypothetical protein
VEGEGRSGDARVVDHRPDPRRVPSSAKVLKLGRGGAAGVELLRQVLELDRDATAGPELRQDLALGQAAVADVLELGEGLELRPGRDCQRRALLGRAPADASCPGSTQPGTRPLTGRRPVDPDSSVLDNDSRRAGSADGQSVVCGGHAHSPHARG